MFDLGKKITVVTGAGSGIGKAIAELFAAQNSTVFLVDLNAGAVEETKNIIVSKGGKAHAIPCNVADQKEVTEIFQQIIQQAGSVDILVNSAGIAHIGKLETTSVNDFDRIFNVNVKGVYNAMFAV